MKRVLVEDGKLKISGFGNFEVKRKKDRRGRNPQTGEVMTITDRVNSPLNNSPENIRQAST